MLDMLNARPVNSGLGCLSVVNGNSVRLWLPTFLMIVPISIVGAHEAARIFGIPCAWHLVFARQALGLHYIRRAGSTLFSRKCRLPIKSAALRTDPQHPTGGLLVG